MKMRYLHKQIGGSIALGMLAVLVLWALLGIGADNLYAQATRTRTPSPTPTRMRLTATPSATQTISPTQTLSPTALLSETATVSPTVSPTVSLVVSPTATRRTPRRTPTLTPVVNRVPVTVTVVVVVTATPIPATPTPTPTVGPTPMQLSETEVLTGTILANRTAVTATLFLEGRLYELPPLRSTGVLLERPFTVLTLYTCEVTPETTRTDCLWDAYPVRQQGFYEIVNSAAANLPINLLLEEAASPPLNQIRLQNRTGHSERFLYRGTLYELNNSSILELTLAAPLSAQEPFDEIYLRRCLGMDGRSVCEWLPQRITGGIYYALLDETRTGLLPNSATITIRLEPLLGEAEAIALLTPTPIPTPNPPPAPPPPTAVPPTPTPAVAVAPAGTVSCQAQVPTLNVRSGPGLTYLVINQIRQSDAGGGRFAAVGRDTANEWLAVDPTLVDGGWVINTPNFVVCQTPTSPLPIAQITDGRLESPPTPTVAAAVPAETEAESPTAEAATPEPPTVNGIPAGQARLVVSNFFEHDVRFTLAALQHGLPEGSPSEYDLQPGQSIEFLLRAGRVQFSASSPFRGSSGNAEFFLEEGMTRQIFLQFLPPAEGTGPWNLSYE